MIRTSFSVMALSLCALATLGAPTASAQSVDELQSRLQRMERDMRDLQAEVYRGNARPRSSGSAGETLPSLAPSPQRMDDLEEGLRRVTGQVEELSHQVNTLSQRLDRMEKERAYDNSRQSLGQNPGADTLAPRPLPPQSADNGPRALAPASGTLGTLPSSAPLPLAPPEAANPEIQFDSAMKLLGRAQYEPARQGFRQYADGGNPKTPPPRAAEALYWSGDIAYSMQKKYDVAARDFAELIKRFPKSPEAPNGMLKLGLSLIALEQKQEGCAALAALPAKYPKAQDAVLTRAKAESGKAGCQ